MATVLHRHGWPGWLVRTLLFASLFLLASGIAAGQDRTVLDPQRAAQIVRQFVSIEADPQPEAVEGQPLRFIVRRSRATRERTAISYRIDDKPVPTFRRTQPSVVIDAGQLSAEIVVPTTDDDVVNGDRPVTVTLMDVSGNAIIGNARAIGMVRDNDTTVAAPRLSIQPNGDVVEGEELSFTIYSDNALPQTRRIAVEVAAADGTLIEPVASSVLLRAGETSTALTLLTADDRILAPPREVRVTLVGDDGFTLDAAQMSARALVDDNDTAPAPIKEPPPVEPNTPPEAEDKAENPATGWAAELAESPLPAIAGGALLLLATLWAARRFILPHFYKLEWDMGVPHAISATSSGKAASLAPNGGVEIDLGPSEALVVGPCPIIAEEERDDADC